MIRRSVVIAIVAIMLSLLVHLFGLSFTTRTLSEHPAEASTPDTVALGTAFEDIAEAAPEPVQPEPAPAPEPPVETPTEPKRAEIPTSQALVASVDPQDVNSPDTGVGEIVKPEATEPTEPGASETDDQTNADQENSTTSEVTPPVEPDTISEAPQGSPEASTAPVEVAPTAPSAPQQLAALPVPVAPTPPVTPVPELTAVPVIPLEPEAVTPEVPKDTVEPVPTDPEISEPDDEADIGDRAVTTSLRPRLPKRWPSEVSNGAPDGSEGFSSLRNPTQTVESPLSLYQRKGIDTFTRGDSGSRSGGRGPGNSDVTNYAGQVLVHLNRTPVVFVPDRGFAKVFFEINPDGTLAWVEIVDNSGSQKINRAAKAQVQNAAPFPRPPGGVSRKLSFFYQNN